MSDIAGRIRPTPPSLRYVVLRHEGIDEPHYDLMFETKPGSALATWRSDKWPIERETALVKVDDHRAAYLEYEGPVSGNRGQVRRVASGYYRLEKLSEMHWRLTFRDTLGFRQLDLTTQGGKKWVAKKPRG
jgi:hypothetical protein